MSFLLLCGKRNVFGFNVHYLLIFLPVYYSEVLFHPLNIAGMKELDCYSRSKLTQTFLMALISLIRNFHIPAKYLVLIFKLILKIFFVCIILYLGIMIILWFYKGKQGKKYLFTWIIFVSKRVKVHSLLKFTLYLYFAIYPVFPLLVLS